MHHHHWRDFPLHVCLSALFVTRSVRWMPKKKFRAIIRPPKYDGRQFRFPLPQTRYSFCVNMVYDVDDDDDVLLCLFKWGATRCGGSEGAEHKRIAALLHFGSTLLARIVTDYVQASQADFALPTHNVYMGWQLTPFFRCTRESWLPLRPSHFLLVIFGSSPRKKGEKTAAHPKQQPSLLVWRRALIIFSSFSSAGRRWNWIVACPLLFP